MVGRCKGCKFWERIEKKPERGGNCSNENFVYSDTDETPITGLAYWDYEGYSAGFSTGEEFGCIHFDPK